MATLPPLLRFSPLKKLTIRDPIRRLVTVFHPGIVYEMPDPRYLRDFSRPHWWWLDKRQEVLQRDLGICQDCGLEGTLSISTYGGVRIPWIGGLVVHHKVVVEEAPELFFDADNCVSLCDDCHKQYHYELLYPPL